MRSMGKDIYVSQLPTRSRDPHGPIFIFPPVPTKEIPVPRLEREFRIARWAGGRPQRMYKYTWGAQSRARKNVDAPSSGPQWASTEAHPHDKLSGEFFLGRPGEGSCVPLFCHGRGEGRQQGDPRRCSMSKCLAEVRWTENARTRSRPGIGRKSRCLGGLSRWR